MPKILKNKVRSSDSFYNTDDIYFCRYCGAEGAIEVSYTETVCGVADLADIHGRTENHEDHESDNFTITEYRCTECDRESLFLEDAATNDWDEVVQEMTYDPKKEKEWKKRIKREKIRQRKGD